MKVQRKNTNSSFAEFEHLNLVQLINGIFGIVCPTSPKDFLAY
jgi:hypothetical protein